MRLDNVQSQRTKASCKGEEQVVMNYSNMHKGAQFNSKAFHLLHLVAHMKKTD